MKKIRLLLCAALTLAVLIPGLSAELFALSDTWDGTSNPSWYSDGASTLVIRTAEDLSAFVSAVNGGNNFSGKTVELASDIVWAEGDSSTWDDTNAPAKKWTPIGNSRAYFSGTFDGKGHTVSGLYYFGKSSTNENVGFFGAVSNATIKNLNIRNSYINAYKTIGSVVGVSSGTLTLKGCTSDAYIVSNYVTPSNHDVGGIVGIVNGGTSAVSVEGCAFYGDITSDNGCNVAGIVGQIKGNPANISGCLAKGTYVGYNRVAGILGRTYGSATISDCYATCKLYTWGTPNLGGILGGSRNGGTVAINNCYYDGEFYAATSATLGGFSLYPTRLGCNEGDLAAFSPSSTFYTDSKNDNSHTAQGNQSGLPLNVTSRGGLEAFLAKTTLFKKDIYGDVTLTTLTGEHDCAEHFGAWIPALTGEGQRRECTYGSCTKTETRSESIDIAGASVKYSGNTGIKILTQVDKNSFFKRYSNATYTLDETRIQLGTVMIPSALLDGELTVDTAGSAVCEANGIYSQTNTALQYYSTFYISGDMIDAYRTGLTVRSYMKYESGGKSVYCYSNEEEISIRDIIEAEYYDSKTTAKRKGELGVPLALASIGDDFFDKCADNVLILENAGRLTFRSFAAELKSLGYKEHTAYEYSDNYFALYYNDEYAVTFYYTPKSIGKYDEPNQDWYAYGPADKRTENMSRIEETVKIEDIDNVMRVIVEKIEDVDLPATEQENTYTRVPGIKNSIAHIFPNDNYNHYGMGYVVQLADGSFIIIDGGENEDDPRDSTSDKDADLLYKYLMSMKPASHPKPVIAAWVLTHRHNDHVEVIQGFIPKYKNKVEIEQVIFNFAAGEVGVPTETRAVNIFGEKYVSDYLPGTKVVTAHTGYKFYIRNSVLTILYSIDDFAPNSIYNGFVNNESIAFDLVIDGEQRIMFTGEVFIPGSRALVNMYGEDLKSDVIQLSHHGHYGATPELYRYIWPHGQKYDLDTRFVLWPIGNEEQRRNRLSLAENAYIISVIKSSGVDDYMSKIHSMCDLIFKSGKVKDSIGSTETKTEVASSGAIGSWEIMPLYTKE